MSINRVNITGNLTRDPELRVAMTRRAGGVRSVPQIFIDGLHVGGSDDLHLLDHQGKLDGLLRP